MNNHAQVAPSALQISGIFVRQDSEGRYCINDLHKAAGHLGRHQPSNWLRTQQAQDLITELEKDVLHIRGTSKDDARIPVSKIQGNGKQQGTYIVKELAISYAMWISASFSLKVIRAYDALQNQLSGNSGQLPKSSNQPAEPLPSGSLSDIDYLKQSRAELMQFIDCCEAAVNASGGKVNQWPELTNIVIDGLIAERIRTSRVLVYFDHDMVMKLLQVPSDSCVISPSDPVSVATFLRESVSSTPDMLSAISSAFITKLTNCQDAAIKRSNQGH